MLTYENHLMLRYLGQGYRRFGLFPLVSEPRVNWEFYAVVEGRCGPIFDHQKPTRLQSRTLWVFPSGSAHGWAGDGPRRAYITAFHFGSVPDQLEFIVRERGHLALPITPEECRQLVKLAGKLNADFHQPTTVSGLRFQGALIELTLLALGKLEARPLPLPEGHAKRTVETAISWFSEHVSQNPSVTEVADQVHVSASTLRRLFRQVRNDSPAHIFARIRLEAAMRLMTATSFKLEIIAAECGFSCMSDFCRAFKSLNGTTPNVWRRKILTGPKHALE